MHLWHRHPQICTSIIPGGFPDRAYYYYFPSIKLITYAFFLICTFSSPLYASIWLKFCPSWVAWLLCLCPMFPLVRLRHKGSTSAIVTAGSSGCVPQTGWSRKLAFLREYSVGGLKMFLHSPHCEPPDVTYTAIVPITVQTCIFTHAHLGKGTLNGTILSGRCFLQS